MSIVTILSDLLFAAVEGICILLIYSILLNNRTFIYENRLKSFIFIVFYTVFCFWATNYVPVGLHTFAIFVFSVINLSIVTSTKLLRAFIVVLVVIIFFMVTETVIFLVISLMIHVSVSDLINTPKLKMYFSLISKAFQVFMILFAFQWKKNFFKVLEEDSNDTVTSYMLLAIFLLGMIILNIDYAVNSNKNIWLYEILIIVVFLIFICLGILVYREKEMLWHIKQKYKLQYEYVKNIETTLNIIRREKHDFSNHINTVYALCLLNKEGTVDRIKAYLEKLIDNMKSNYRYFDTGNEYVDGLLTVKSNVAFSHEIHLDVDFEAPLSLIPIKEYDLISVISNIIDNAFEAVLSEPNNEQKIVSIYTYVENDNFYLSISNNGPAIPKEIVEKIFQNGFSTKKINKEDHGLGLFITKKLIERHNGEITVESTEIETEFLMKFPLERKKEKGRKYSTVQ